MNHFNKFVDYICELCQKDLGNPDLENQVYKCLIDYTSAIIGGCRIWHDRITTILDNAFDSGDYCVVGHMVKTSLEVALLSNGLQSHVAELDDGVIEGIIHPGAPIFTSLFTVFQKTRIDWGLFVKAVTVGYEVACRLAEAIQPGHKLLGYHATATCGTIGVAVALAVISRFSKDQMKETIAIAMASSHGTLKVLEDQSELKPYNVATAAINGFIAFQMAKAGFKGADNPFDGEAGFFAQMSNEVFYENLYGDSQNLCIFRTYFKPYASCRYTHPSIEAAKKIKALYKINPDEIESIRVATYSIAIKHHDHTDVPNISSAKMCIPFATAVAIIKESGGIDAFCEASVKDSRIRELTKKVRVVEDKDYSSLFPRKSIATVTVKTNNGEEFSATINTPKGEAGNPMKHDDLLRKLQQSCIFAGYDFNGVIEYINTIKNNQFDDYIGNLNKSLQKND